MPILFAEMTEIITTGKTLGKVRPFGLSGTDDGNEHFIGTGTVVNLDQSMQKCIIKEETYSEHITWTFITFDWDFTKAYPIRVTIQPNYNSNMARNVFDYSSDMKASTIIFPRPISYLLTELNNLPMVPNYITLPELIMDGILNSVEDEHIRKILFEKNMILKNICHIYVNELPHCLTRTSTSILAKEISDLCDLEKKLVHSGTNISNQYIEAFLPVLSKRVPDWRFAAVAGLKGPLSCNLENKNEYQGHVNISRIFRIVPPCDIFQNKEDEIKPRLHIDVERATKLVENPLDYDELRDIYLILSGTGRDGWADTYTLYPSSPPSLRSAYANDECTEVFKCDEEIKHKLLQWLMLHHPEEVSNVQGINIRVAQGEITIVITNRKDETLVVFMDMTLCALCTQMIVYQ